MKTAKKLFALLLAVMLLIGVLAIAASAASAEAGAQGASVLPTDDIMGSWVNGSGNIAYVPGEPINMGGSNAAVESMESISDQWFTAGTSKDYYGSSVTFGSNAFDFSKRDNAVVSFDLDITSLPQNTAVHQDTRYYPVRRVLGLTLFMRTDDGDNTSGEHFFLSISRNTADKIVINATAANGTSCKTTAYDTGVAYEPGMKLDVRVEFAATTKVYFDGTLVCSYDNAILTTGMNGPICRWQNQMGFYTMAPTADALQLTISNLTVGKAPCAVHTPGAAATCDTAQKCTVCNAVLAEATGHDFSLINNPANGTRYTVATASCEAPEQIRLFCSKCGARDTVNTPYGEALGHKFDDCEDTVCDRIDWNKGGETCGLVRVAPGHTGGTATCTEQAVCEVCTKPYGDPADHDFSLHQNPANGSIDYQDWVSCTKPYMIRYYCSECGARDTVNKPYGEPLGHKYDDCVDTDCNTCGTPRVAPGHTGGEATCTEAAVCEVCTKPYGEVLGHTGGEATCTEAAVCTRCEQPYGELAAHDFSVINNPANGTRYTVKTATCEAPEQIRLFCSKCGARDTVNTPYGEALGHKYDDCEDTVCDRIDWNVGADATCGETRVAPGHTGGTATCTAQAVCEVCGKPYGEFGDHVYSSIDRGQGDRYVAKWQTCTEPFMVFPSCPLCGAYDKTQTVPFGEPAGHKFDEGTCDTTCNRVWGNVPCDGVREGEEYGHKFDSPYIPGTETLDAQQWVSCTDPYIIYYYCSVCGEKESVKREYGEPLGHAYDDCADADCNRCGEPRVAPGHIGGEATCTEQAVCEVCTKPYGDVLGHIGGEATCTAQAVCTRCGEPYGELADHVFDQLTGYGPDWIYVQADATCTEPALVFYHCECGERGNTYTAWGEPKGHTGGTASCTAQAVCTRCGESYGEFADHVYSSISRGEGDRYVAKWQTCTEPFMVFPSCPLCGAYDKTQTVPFGEPAGHKFDEGTCDTTCNRVWGNVPCDGVREGEEYGHKFDSPYIPGTETIDYQNWATCTDPYMIRYYCSLCGVKDTVDKPYGEPAGHLFNDGCIDSTCDRVNAGVPCDFTRPAGNHNPGPEGDCQNPQTCTDCQAVLAEGHKFDSPYIPGTETLDAQQWVSCTDPYIIYYYCSVCGEKESVKREYGWALGHAYDDCADANCNRNGCTFVREAPGHIGGEATCTAQAVCEVCTKPYGEVLGHIGGTATCTAQAVCTRCGESYGELEEHVFDQLTGYGPDWIYVQADATCTEPALVFYHCECGQRGNTYTEWGEPKGHTGGKATCTAQAVCTRCGESYGEFGDHVYSSIDRGEGDRYVAKWQTCTEPFMVYPSCPLCGAYDKTQTVPYGEPAGHKFDEGTCDTTCNRVWGNVPCDGVREGEEYGHKFDSPYIPGTETIDYQNWATCTDPYIIYYYCSVCGEKESVKREYGEPLGHKYDDCVDAGCNECGEPRVAPGHIGGEATCTAQAVCEVCDKSYGEVLGHIGGEATCIEAAVCTRCEQPYGTALGHTKGEVVVENEKAADCVNGGSYDNVTYCVTCGVETSRETIETDALGHTKGEVVVENEVAADCDDNGSYDNVTYCVTCGVETSRETIETDALGHTEGEVEIENNVAPSYTAPGSYDEVVYCSVCDAELDRNTVTVPQLQNPVAEVDGELFGSLQAAVDAAEGKTVKLLMNVDLKTIRLTINTNTTLDLNGYTLTSKDKGDSTNAMAIYVKAGKTFTLADSVGTGKVISTCYGVYVQQGATFIMNGGSLELPGTASYDLGVVVWNGNFIMNGGTIKARVGVFTCDYYNADASTVVINDGTIIVSGIDKEEPSVILWNDPNYPKGATFTVKGGAFNELASVLPNAVAGSTIKLAGNITPDPIDVVNSDGKAFTAAVVIDKNITLDGQGYTIDATTCKYGIYTVGGTIKNVKIINGSASRAIFLDATAAYDLYLDGVYADGTYALSATMNTRPAAKINLYVKNSTLLGWTSYSDLCIASATFENCTFGTSSSGYAYFKPYVDANIIGENTVFAEGYTIDASKAETTIADGIDTTGIVIADGAHLLDGVVEKHSHVAVVTDPTCTADGYTTYTCACGDEYTDDEVDALGHTKGEVVVENEKAADCVNGGSYDNVTYCVTCGIETSRETIKTDALGHTKGEVVVENEVAADCDDNGSYDNVTYCVTCGVETSRETIETDALGHDEETVAGSEATCTVDGLTDGVQCSVCGDWIVEQKAIDALGHDWTEVNEDGTLGCSRCDAVNEAVTGLFKDEAGNYFYLINGVPANGAVYVEVDYTGDNVALGWYTVDENGYFLNGEYNNRYYVNGLYKKNVAFVDANGNVRFVDASGTLYVSGTINIQNIEEGCPITAGWYTFVDGTLAEGEIDNHYYVGGVYKMNVAFVDANGNVRFADANGILFENGRINIKNVEEGCGIEAGWYTFSNGVLVRSGIVGDYFYDENGNVKKSSAFMFEGVIYYTTEDGSFAQDGAVYIATVEDGIDMATGWYTFANGALAEGVIGDRYYEDGLYRSGIAFVDKNGIVRYANADGSLFQEGAINIQNIEAGCPLTAGWYTFVDGTLAEGIVGDRYYENGVYLKSAVFMVDNVLKFTNAEGYFVEDGAIYIANVQDGIDMATGWYTLANGALAEGEVGNRYYEGGLYWSGKAFVDKNGDVRYANASGSLFKNGAVYIQKTADNCDLATGWYRFDADGYLLNGEYDGATFVDGVRQ